MTDKKNACPSCGKPAAGNFCSNCGTTLGGRFCNQCGASLDGSAKFCNQCGARSSDGAAGAGPTRGGASRARAGGGAAPDGGVHPLAAGNTPWWIAGAAMFGMILVVGWNMVQPAGPVAGPGQGGMGASAGAANGAATTDITQMSPREAADRLFNRVMTTASAGDTAGAQAFLPMAIGAYERAMPLDMDGYFHMALLQITGAEYDGALAVAQEILDVYPDHLLGLASAGDAAAGAGRMDEAREYFTHIIRVFDAEVGRALPEYEGHQSYLTELKARAEAFVSAH